MTPERMREIDIHLAALSLARWLCGTTQDADRPIALHPLPDERLGARLLLDTIARSTPDRAELEEYHAAVLAAEHARGEARSAKNRPLFQQMGLIKCGEDT